MWFWHLLSTPFCPFSSPCPHNVCFLCLSKLICRKISHLFSYPALFIFSHCFIHHEHLSAQTGWFMPHGWIWQWKCYQWYLCDFVMCMVSWGPCKYPALPTCGLSCSSSHMFTVCLGSKASLMLEFIQQIWICFISFMRILWSLPSFNVDVYVYSQPLAPSIVDVTVVPSGVSFLSRLGFSLKPYQCFHSVFFSLRPFIISVYTLIANHLKHWFHRSKMVHLSWFGKYVVCSPGGDKPNCLSAVGLWTTALMCFHPWHLLLWLLPLMICYQ